MNPVYIRMALYTLAGLVTAAGVGTFDAARGTLTFNLDDLALIVAGSGFINGVVFALWGKK